MDSNRSTSGSTDPILDLAIYYVLNDHSYGQELESQRKRAVRKRASKLIVERGEVYFMKKNRKVSVAQEKLLVFACTTDESTKNKRRTASSLNRMPQ